MNRVEELKGKKIEIALSKEWVINTILEVEQSIGRELLDYEIAKILVYQLGYVDYCDNTIINELVKLVD